MSQYPQPPNYGPQFGAPAPNPNPYPPPAQPPAAYPGQQPSAFQFNMGAPPGTPRGPMNDQQRAMLFAGTGGGAVQRIKGNYVKPGHYWAQIKKTKAGMSSKKHGTGYVAIELVVIKRLAGDDIHSNAVGEDANHIIQSGTFYFAGNVNNFVGAVLGIPAEQVQPEQAMTLFDEVRNPLCGTVVEVVAKPIMTRQQTPFTQVSYLREVKAAEVLQGIPQQIKDRFFQNQYLERQAAQDAANGVQPPAVVQQAPAQPAAAYTPPPPAMPPPTPMMPPNFQPPAMPPPVAPQAAPSPQQPWQQPQRQPVWNPQTNSWQ